MRSKLLCVKVIAIPPTATSCSSADSPSRQSMTKNSKNFAIVGAGPMGLMAALRLLEKGHNVDIFERDDRIGGMSASFDFDGLKIERYYHFVCKTDYPLFA